MDYDNLVRQLLIERLGSQPKVRARLMVDAEFGQRVTIGRGVLAAVGRALEKARYSPWSTRTILRDSLAELIYDGALEQESAEHQLALRMAKLTDPPLIKKEGE
jgi:hypothetical protein